MTALVWSAAIVLLVWGNLRKWQSHRLDAVMLAITVFTVLSMILGSVYAMPRLSPILAVMDGIMVVAMAAIWSKFHSQRARFVGSIGLAKVCWAMAAWGYSAINWASYAAALNAGFFAQALVAGGFLDGLGHWISDLHRGFSDRARRFRRYVV